MVENFKAVMNKLAILEKYILSHKEALIIGAVLLIATLTRLLFLGSVPAGINQDEAYAAYEACSLLTTGADSSGNTFPVYFVSWGSGMNVLYSYFSIPFFAFFGVSPLTARLPQALFGILSCWVFFRLVTLMYNKRIGLIAFFLAAILPWHIMMSRWGLEANFVVFFILAGFYFFIKSYQRIPYLFLSALFYGLGIYAYSCCSIYIACLFAFQLGYRLYSEFNKKTILYVLGAGFLFSLIVLPFILFILVNNDIIPEIKSFMTVPKLVFWRQGDVSLADFSQKLKDAYTIFYSGNDRLIWNSVKEYGLFYPISFVFVVVGFYKIIRGGCLSGEYGRNNIILSGALLIGILCAGLIHPNVNRLNFLWFNVILLLAIGIDALFSGKKGLIFIVSIYLGFFMSFYLYYLTGYNGLTKHYFQPDLEKSLQLAEEWHEKYGYSIRLGFSTDVYPKVLFYQQLPPSEFRENLQWDNPHASWRGANSFAYYKVGPWDSSEKIAQNTVYIIPKNKRAFFPGFAIFEAGEYEVAVPENKHNSSQF